MCLSCSSNLSYNRVERKWNTFFPRYKNFKNFLKFSKSSESTENRRKPLLGSFCQSQKVFLLTMFTIRTSHQRCSIRKGVLRNFTKFIGKHLCKSLFSNKVAGLRPFFTEHLWATASIQFYVWLNFIEVYDLEQSNS